MLAVNRQQPAPPGSHGLHEDLATDHQRLFVGEQQALAGARRRHAGWQPRSTDDGRHDDIGLLMFRYDFNSCIRPYYLGFKTILLKFLCQKCRVRRACHHGELRLELLTLGQQQINLRGGAERKNLETVRVPGDHVQRVDTD